MKAERIPEEPPSVRQQVAALPYRLGAGVEIMVVSSRETRRWVLPKGWPMKGKSLHASAEREALEEAGIEGVISAQALGQYHYVKRMKNGSTPLCAVSVYPLLVTRQRETWRESAERTTRWMPVEAAAQAVHEPDLREIILAFGERILAGAKS